MKRPGDKTQRGVLITSGVLLVLVGVISFLLSRSVKVASGVDTAGAGVTAFTLALASAAVGAALGFLFGLPRARETEEQVDDGRNVPGRGMTSHFLHNSNLIKVSDWVTTIVVGLTLVNLAGVPSALGELQQNLTQPLGGAAFSGVVGLTLLVATALAGFVLNYLWTSIRVRELLEESESRWAIVPELVDKHVAEAERELAPFFNLDAGGSGPDGKITRQDIPPGTVVRAGSTVTVDAQ